MSRKKNSITYIKPEEPKFLRELKAAAGFKEAPTVDTKRQEFPDYDEDDEYDEKAEEEPVVVVLKNGDMTADEAENFKKKKDEEEANAPADLSKRIVFRKSKTQDTEKSKDVPSRKKSRKSKPTKSVLSFDDEEND